MRALRRSDSTRRSAGARLPATEVITHFAQTPQPFDFFDRVADEPMVPSKLDELRRDPNEGDWLGLERYVLAPPQAYLVPLEHERVTTFFSDRMDPTALTSTRSSATTSRAGG